MTRVTPVSGVKLNVPSSVFVSAGRYSQYLTMIFIVGYGAVGYILLHLGKNRWLAYLGLGASPSPRHSAAAAVRSRIWA